MVGRSTGEEDGHPTDRLPDRSRDRAATEVRILDAAQQILTDTGPAGFGVNAVARSAGVDKQLIYRYYGGLDGLLVALGARIGLWWQERLLEDGLDAPPSSYGALVERLMLRLVRIMRTEPLAWQSTLWELTDGSGLVRPLAKARAAALAAWILRVRGDLRPPEGVDAAALNALVVSAISYVVLASRTSDAVVGLDMTDPQSWERIEEAVKSIVRNAYREAQGDGGPVPA